MAIDDYAVSDQLRIFAEPIVKEWHKELITYRVPLEFVFCKLDPKQKPGYDVKVYKDLPGWLAGQPKSEQLFEVSTYVCSSCVNWSPGEPNIDFVNRANGDLVTLKICEKCLHIMERMDRSNRTAVDGLLGRNTTAEKRMKNGHEESPGVFVIVIYEASWKQWSDEKKKERMDRCLTRCCVTRKKEVTKLSLLQYDLQGYKSVYERHGLHFDDPSGKVLAGANKSLKVAHQTNTEALFENDDTSDDDAVLAAEVGTAAKDWQPATLYEQGEIVKGSNGNWYSSIIGGNLGFDPVSNDIYWRRMAAV